MLKLDTHDEIRGHLKEALTGGRWVIAGPLSHLHVVAEVASIAEALGFSPLVAKVAVPRRHGDHRDVVVVCFATFEREALTDRQMRGFLPRNLPDSPIPDAEPLPSAIAVTTADCPAEVLAGFLQAAAAGLLLTPAEQADRNRGDARAHAHQVPRLPAAVPPPQAPPDVRVLRGVPAVAADPRPPAPDRDPLERLDPDVRVVDCARCGRHLAAPGQPPCELEEVAGRVYGRPVCRRCLPAARREPMPAENRFLAQVTQEG